MKVKFKLINILLFLLSFSAEAANIGLSGVFRNNPTIGFKNSFEYTSLSPAIACIGISNYLCNNKTTQSSVFPITFKSAGKISEHSSVGATIPTDWRRFDVVNARTNRTETVEIRFVALRGRFNTPNLSNTKLGRENGVYAAYLAQFHLWLRDDLSSSSILDDPSGPCIGDISFDYKRFNSYSNFSWEFENQGFCYVKNSIDLDFLNINNLDVFYEIRSPKPMDMIAGDYSGSITYSVGNGGDFHMGDHLFPDDNTLTLDVNLSVEHSLKVDLPPNGNKIVLEPEGGWRQWIDRGRVPSRIFRDQNFYLSSTGPFKVGLECQFKSTSGACQLRDNIGNVTEVDTFISLPDYFTYTGAPLKRVHLKDSTYVDPILTGNEGRGMGTFHFDIPSAAITSLLGSSSNTTYSGQIVIILDSVL
ncbi:hypothetical protein [Pseudomonas sp. CCNWLW23]|uniref:hypothetical protein n=1 Tax=Pseudomonas sp. CCNWLW23 TaxID=3126385 RepID=UPI00301304B9